MGAARAIAALEPPGVEVHFLIAATENMVNERGVVPGDILVASNGKTIEVLNTDAVSEIVFLWCNLVLQLFESKAHVSVYVFYIATETTP